MDAQFGTGDEAAVIGGQKQCGGGDFLRATQPVERYRRDERCIELVGGLHRVGLTVEHGGVDRAGARGVEGGSGSVAAPFAPASVSPGALSSTRQADRLRACRVRSGWERCCQTLAARFGIPRRWLRLE